MSNKSELHLIVPGLCGPLAETQSVKKSDEFNTWLKRLCRAKQSSSQANVYEVIASIFHLKFDNDFPTAALSLFAQDKYDENKSYLCADPVHLQADLSQAVLTSSDDLAINEQESAALRDSLNQHFKQDGLEIISLNNNQWFVASDNTITMKTTALPEAVGRNVNFILPQGKDSTPWKQVLTEAQMLMHMHDVNSKRENAAQLTINSLWFHGCGALPDIREYQRGKRKIDSVCSHQNLLQGVAQLVESEYILLPENAGDYLEQLLDDDDDSVNVLHLPALQHLVNYSDSSIWLEKLIELLQHWVYPLLTMANKNNIKITVYPCNGTQYVFSKHDVLKVWKRAVLEQHVSCY